MDTRACQPIRASLIAYVDGELGAKERQAVDDHLRGCAECLRELDGIRQVSLMVREAFEEGPGADEQWLAALRRGKERIAALRRPRRRIPLAVQRLLRHPVQALAAMIVLSVAVAETLNLLGLEQEGLQVLSYLLSLSLS